MGMSLNDVPSKGMISLPKCGQAWYCLESQISLQAPTSMFTNTQRVSQNIFEQENHQALQYTEMNRVPTSLLCPVLSMPLCIDMSIASRRIIEDIKG